MVGVVEGFAGRYWGPGCPGPIIRCFLVRSISDSGQRSILLPAHGKTFADVV